MFVAQFQHSPFCNKQNQYVEFTEVKFHEGK